MTKNVILIVLLCVVGLLKQADAQTQFSIGIKAGVNLSSLDTEKPVDAVKNNFQAGFNAGIMTLLKIAKFGIQPEVLFSRQGPSVETSGATSVLIQDYINVPIVFKYYPVGGLNIQFGPQFGFLMGAEADAGGIKLDVKDNYEDVDIGLTMGLGWDLPLGFTIDARYNMGLTPVNKNADQAITGASKNQVIQFSVGYKLIKFGK